MPVPVFTAGEVLTAANMNKVGLWLIKTQTVTGTPSTVVVNDAFSADYTNYKVTYTDGALSSAGDIFLQLNGLTTAYYGSFYFDNFTGSPSGVNRRNNGSNWFAGGGSTNYGMVNCDVINPFIARYTTFTMQTFSGNEFTVQGAGIQAANTSATGFTLSAGGATFSGGTVRVYGYRL
jgi:hypothetical protein